MFQPPQFTIRLFPCIVTMLMVVIFYPCSITAQPKPFTVYTSEDGLLTNQIFDLKRDSDGFVWIATGEGVNIYDGTRFRSLLPENGQLSAAPAWSLFEPRPGEMWVSTSKGIDVFKNHEKVFTFQGHSSAAQFLKLKNGETLVVTIYGVSLVKGHEFQLLFSSPRHLSGLTEVGNVILTRPINTDTLIILDKHCRLIKKMRLHGGYMKDAYDHLWLLTDGKVRPVDIDALEKGEIKFQSPPTILDRYNHDVSDFYRDREGYYWLAQYRKGITLISEDGLAKQYTMKDGLPSNEISVFKEDREGNIWIIGNAMIRFGFKNLHHFSSLNGMKATNCWSVAEHKSSGSIWLLHTEGISCFYSGNFFFFPLLPESIRAWGMMEIYGDSLIVNANRLAYYRISFTNRPNLQFIKEQSFYKRGDREGVFRHYRDNDGNIWVLSNHKGTFQLNKIDKSGKVQWINSEEGQVRLLVEDNKLWTGGWGAAEGIFLYSITQHSDSVSLNLIHRFKPLPDNSIRSFCKDDLGNVWAGTRNSGLLQFIPKSDSGYTIRHFTKKDGLKGNWIRNIAIGKQGLLVATDHGTNLIRNVAGKIFIHDIIEKSSMADASWDVLQTEKDGLIWVATENGAVRIVNKQQLANQPPPIFITHASSNNITLQIDSLKNASILSPQRDNIYFEFSSTLLSYEKNILYSYRLIQRDDEGQWSPPSSQTSVTYASLSPGNYVFEVKALVNNSTWSRAPAIWTFTILRPIWQRWWFYSLVTLIVLLTAYLFIHEIIYRKLEKQRLVLEKQRAIDIERLRISSELHDDLGGGLSTIRLMSELIQSNDKNGESKKQLEKISANSKELVQQMNEIVWALNIKNDNLAGLLAYIRQYTVRFLDDNMLDCELTIPDQVPALAITGSRRRDIFLLVKESLNNIVKHARASKVDIGFTIDNLLQIKIHDDGVGFDATKLTTTSNGLRNMGKRINELTGTMTIKNHQGTTLVFDIPLKNLSHESVQ